MSIKGDNGGVNDNVEQDSNYFNSPGVRESTILIGWRRYGPE
jgi:hypothetical protein